MATHKSTASKSSTSKTTTAATPRTAKGRKTSRAPKVIADMLTSARRGAASRGASGMDATDYVAPGAIVLASGALAAMGYIFKEQIGGVVVDVLKATAKRGAKAAMAVDGTREDAMDAMEKLTDNLSLDTVLKFAGLQRRSTMGAILGPAIGVGCGLVAGATLTYFFGPKILEQLKEVGEAAADAVKSTTDAADGMRASRPMGVASVNGAS